MFCTKCGAAVPSSAKFCTGCGNQVAPPSPGDASTAPRTSQSFSPGASVATGADVAGRTPLNSVPISQLSKPFKITLLCVLGGPLWLLALFATLAGHDFSVKMWGIGFLLGLSGLIYLLVRMIRNSSDPVAAAASPKGQLSSAQLIQSIGGLALAGFVVWYLNSGSSVANTGSSSKVRTADSKDLEGAASAELPAVTRIATPSQASCDEKANRISKTVCATAGGVDMFGRDGDAVFQLLNNGSYTSSTGVEGGKCWAYVTVDGTVRGNSYRRSFKCELDEKWLN
jgi:hypothetical protein